MLAFQLSTLTRAWGWSASDRTLNILPLHHVHGLVNVLLCALYAGARCDFPAAADGRATTELTAAALLEADPARRLTVFMAVPTIYSQLLAWLRAQAPAVRGEFRLRCSAFRLMVSGSAALPLPALAAWEREAGALLLERYGMSEIGMALSQPLDEAQRRAARGTVGGPLPGVRVRVAPMDADAEDASPAAVEAAKAAQAAALTQAAASGQNQAQPSSSSSSPSSSGSDSSASPSRPVSSSSASDSSFSSHSDSVSSSSPASSADPYSCVFTSTSAGPPSPLVGELLVSGPGVFRSYWNRPDTTAAQFDAEGWFRTGDVVEVTATAAGLDDGAGSVAESSAGAGAEAAANSGSESESSPGSVLAPAPHSAPGSVPSLPLFRLLGRASVDVLKSGGYKISALDVERELLAHAQVEGAAVVGLPDAHYGQIVAAVVQLRRGAAGEGASAGTDAGAGAADAAGAAGAADAADVADSAAAADSAGAAASDPDSAADPAAPAAAAAALSADLQRWCRSRLAAYQIPRRWRFVEQIPRNAMGKVNKRELAKIFDEEEQTQKEKQQQPEKRQPEDPERK